MYSLLFLLSPASHSSHSSSLLTFFSPHLISLICHSKIWKWIVHVVFLLPLPPCTLCLWQGVEHLVQYFTDTAWYSNTLSTLCLILFFNMKPTCCPLWPQLLHAGLWFDRSMLFYISSFACFVPGFQFDYVFILETLVCSCNWMRGWGHSNTFLVVIFSDSYLIYSFLLCFILKTVFCYCAVVILSFTPVIFLISSIL